MLATKLARPHAHTHTHTPAGNYVYVHTCTLTHTHIITLKLIPPSLHREGAFHRFARMGMTVLAAWLESDRVKQYQQS